MKLKELLSFALIAFVVGSVTYMVVTELRTSSTVDNDRQSENPDVKSQLIVYYFFNDVRCPTCRKLESYAKEALDTYFVDELTTENIVWKPVNVDGAGNEHFIEDYKLVTKSIILSQLENAKEIRWKNLDRIWREVGDKQKYIEYIHSGIIEFQKDEQL